MAGGPEYFFSHLRIPKTEQPPPSKPPPTNLDNLSHGGAEAAIIIARGREKHPMSSASRWLCCCHGSSMTTILMAIVLTASFILMANYVGATTTDDAAVAVAPTHPPPGGSTATTEEVDTFVPDPNAPITFCLGGCPSDQLCVGNRNHPQGMSDDDCAPCNSGQTFWPCDTEGLCFCWDDASADRIPPAPGSGLALHDDATRPCDYFARDVFETLAPEARGPYTYDGLCDAIDNYNDGHAEKIFMMGTERERKSEVRDSTTLVCVMMCAVQIRTFEREMCRGRERIYFILCT